MKDKKFVTLGAILVALVAVVGVSAASFAYEGDQSQQYPAPWQNSPGFDEEDIAAKKAMFEEKRAERKAKMEVVKTALDNNDYQAWLEAVSGTPMAEEVTEDEFPRLIEAHNLAQEGKALLEQSREIREEIGLKPFKKGKKGFGQRMMGHGGMGAHQIETE